ncbi:DnaJ domain-containing protein, partial [Cephalotus follicularis]
KSQLVLEICSISKRSIACAHRHYGRSIKSRFIDWYHLLGVEEDAGIDVIRKRYHKLALQLHPDKNKHPKADIAFKFVSEAYTCLSDHAKRRAFNLERLRNFCIECNKIPYTSCNSPINSLASKHNAWKPTIWSRSSRILQGLRDVRERFKEETSVIENCLRANAASRKESPLFNSSDYLLKSNNHNTINKESPVFNPADYVVHGYPHLRTGVYKTSENWYFKRRNIPNYEQEREKHNFPIFENGPDIGMFRSKSACIRT